MTTFFFLLFLFASHEFCFFQFNFIFLSTEMIITSHLDVLKLDLYKKYADTPKSDEIVVGFLLSVLI